MSSSSSVLFQLCCTWAFNARHCTTLAQYTLNIAQYTLNSTALPVKHSADVLPCYTAPTLSNTATLLHFYTSTLLQCCYFVLYYYTYSAPLLLLAANTLPEHCRWSYSDNLSNFRFFLLSASDYALVQHI